MYHINLEFEVGKCGATTIARCPFANSHEGSAHHYSDLNDALTASEKLYKDKHGAFATSASPFAKNKATISEHMTKWGLATTANPLPEANSTREIIDKWFAGKTESYSAIKELIEDEDLNSDTKKDIAILHLRGLNVSTINNVRTLGIAEKENTNSQITIISEDSDRVSTQDIQDGNAVLNF